MNRYSRILNKNPREIVLIKSRPCKWGRCFFCDYIQDNEESVEKIVEFNKEVLKEVRGDLKQLEIINSASVFEIPRETLEDIKDLAEKKKIKTLYFECHYSYRHRLDEIREFFKGQDLVFKCGIETFNEDFRNNYLRKGAYFDSYEEVGEYFDSICIMVGIKGQTKDMIRKDMEILTGNFKRGCINVYTKNSTPVEPDHDLIKWFREEYAYLEDLPNMEVLWNNTDFGVGD